MRNDAVAPAEAIAHRSAAIQRKLVAAFGEVGDHPPKDPLLLLAERLSAADRHAHVLLAPLASFDEALFTNVIAPRVKLESES